MVPPISSMGKAERSGNHSLGLRSGSVSGILKTVNLGRAEELQPGFDSLFHDQITKMTGIGQKKMNSGKHPLPHYFFIF